MLGTLIKVITITLMILLGVMACGQTGDLKLPDKSPENPPTPNVHDDTPKE